MSTGISSLSTGVSSLSTGITNITNTINNINTKGAKYFHVTSTLADSDASGQDSVAVGPNAVASGVSAVAMGLGAQAVGDNATAIGAGAKVSASASQGTAIGFGAVVEQSGGVALGSGSRATTGAGMVGYVPGSATAQQAEAIRATTSTQAAVSVGDAANGQFRQITGVAAGSADSDATNVAQLKASAAAVQAGGVQYATNPDGSVNYGQVTLGNGQAPFGTRISNVAPGILPTDAVNVSQLSQVQNQIGESARIAYSGVAMAGAMAGLPQVEAGKRFSMGLGVGNYAGYSAMAIGASARVNENTIIKFGLGTSSGGKVLVNAGIGYSW